MANLIRFFLELHDEQALYRTLARLAIDVYPLRIPQDWKPFRADETAIPKLPDEGYWAASSIGAVQVDRVKRGPDKGSWRVDEVRSPVIYFHRSARSDDSELLSGRIWAEMDVTPQTGRRDPAPDRFRRLFVEVEGWFRKTCRKSEPAGFWIGPEAARRFREGLVLRVERHRNEIVRPFR